MDQEDDIPTKGPDSDAGYDKAAEWGPNGPVEEKAPGQPDAEEGLPEGDDEGQDLSDLDNTVSTLGKLAKESDDSDEPPQPVGSEGGDPKLDTTTPADGGSQPDIPFEPEQAGPDDSVGFSEDVPPEDIPVTETHTEEAAPDLEGLGEDDGGIEAFGNQVEAFNAAGGADGGFSGGDGGSDAGGGEDGLHQFAEANTQLHTAQFDFLKDHARALSDLQRRLEIERL